MARDYQMLRFANLFPADMRMDSFISVGDMHTRGQNWSCKTRIGCTVLYVCVYVCNLAMSSDVLLLLLFIIYSKAVL